MVNSQSRRARRSGDSVADFFYESRAVNSSGEQGRVLLVEPRCLQETLGDSEKLALPIKVARERDAEGLAIRPEARRYCYHRVSGKARERVQAPARMPPDTVGGEHHVHFAQRLVSFLH